MRVTPTAVKVRISPLRRFAYARAAFFAALAAALAFATIGGCGGSTTECKQGLIKEGDDCAKECEAKGGLLQEGACIAKCDATKCLDGNTCVDNQCKLVCTTFKDCAIASQDCLPAKEDETGKDILICQESNKAPFATSCPQGTECGAILACPNGDSCDYTQCGGQTCGIDKVACAGVTDCAIGVCPDGTTACKIPGCAQADCKPMTCITKGEGDADAYCSINDCNADTDCPSSFYCGIVHDPHDICNSTMDTAQEKGNNNFCGTTDEACIDPNDFTKGGRTYFEGSICLLRKACIERKQCDPCSFDGACENLQGGQCADVAGEQRCVVACSTDTDCQPDYKCVDGGRDGSKVCKPRFEGGCVGHGNFCEPCQNDEDCGGKDTRKACVSASRNQRACEDLALPKACTADTECGKNDDGDNLHCWGGTATPHLVKKLDKATGQLPEGLMIRSSAPNIAFMGYAATGEIVSVNLATKAVTHFAQGPALANGTLGYLLGIADNPKTHEVYFAVASFNVAMVTPGIYKVPSSGGTGTLVASDPQMVFPNGLAFDAQANLYVTESTNGLIFKVVGTTATVWLDDPSLKGSATGCTPATPTPIGANGIFLRGTGASAVAVVSNTNLGQIVSVPIDMATGAAGTPTIIAGPDCATLGGIDGIYNDGVNNTIVGALNGQDRIVSVAFTGGVVKTIFEGAPLNGPASVAPSSLYGTQLVFTNSDFFNGGSGPALMTMVLHDNCTPGTQCGAYHTCQSCDSDVDCPKSPSGLHGHCFGTPWTGDDSAFTDGVFPADECVPLLYQGQIYCDGYKSCSLPIPDLASLQSGCWPAPTSN